MKKYSVYLIDEAERDLVDIYRAISVSDSQAKADIVLDHLERLCGSLADFPLRGHVPPELERIGVTQYREVHFKPYRVVYEVAGRKVFIHCVLDGRRDLQELLQRRLVRS
jgi:toxin ParE1/3/4